MPKNNKGQNAFYFFMIDWKKEQEKAGKSFPEGLRDVQRDPQLSIDWKNMPAHQKGQYEARAKDSKVKSQGTTAKKTTLGENIADLLAAEKKKQEFQQNMLQYIDSVISMGVQHNSLGKMKFMLVHANWFYRREVGINQYDFCPAEFAVAEFSLDRGIENVYHEVVSTKIPLGWRKDALETSQETHKITIEHPNGQSDFAYMYRRLVKVLASNKTGDKYPPLFTMKDLTPAINSLLKRMCEAAGNLDNFVIYSLEALFAALRNVATQNVKDDCSIPLVVAENEFGKDTFSSVAGLECEFHKLLDAPQYCSMSIVKRWGFTICDYSCEYLDIPMIEGVHYPMNKLSFNSRTAGTLNIQMNNLSINDHNNVGVSMTGVSADHRRKVSERTEKDEQRRRNVCKSLEIIDHSKYTSNTVRILRLSVLISNLLLLNKIRVL
ncbi:Protein maelstrom like protein [Dufourea novaeangliae]|uniref:Protein maelstrom like protein n=1 Tax=Dufourea novaeangliae TaxID=178035 RepID=A0A154PA32_DUFNO|nr:Protein maelstrom like protein [Dufourea novaeangliae]